MGKLTLIAIALCCNVLHLSNAGSALDHDFFQSLGKEDKGYEVITPARIRKAMKLLKQKANSLDICFLVDITGSMKHYIQAVRDSIKHNVMELKEKAVKTVRMSFVGYRDFGDKTKIKIIPFTTNVDNFLNKVGKVPATGGKDFHEDVYTGLLEATKRNWKSHKRAIIHMADSPCHGPGCRSNSKDDTKDLLNRNIEDIFTKVLVKRIFYTFGRIKPYHTDAMIKTFSVAYGKKVPLFEVDLDICPSGRHCRILHGPEAEAKKRKVLKRKVGEAIFGAAILAITD